MAEEKIIIAEIDIDLDQSIKDTQVLKEQVNLLKEETKRLKETEGETSAEYIKSSAELKVLQKNLRDQEKITQNVITANNANTGSLTAMKAELSIVTKKWNDLSEEERLNSEEGKALTARKLELTEALKAEEKATGDTRRNVGNYAEGMKEATGAMNDFVPGAGKVTNSIGLVNKAFKVLNANPIIAILTAIIAGFVALTKALKRSEEGQNALAKIGAVLKSIFETIADVVTKLGEKIVKAFEDPQQAVKDLWDVIKNNIANRIIALGQIFTSLGDIATNSFKIIGGEIKNFFKKTDTDLSEFKDGLKTAIVDLGKAQLQLITGVKADELINTFKKIVDEVKDDIDATIELKNRQAELDKLIRDNLVLEANDRLKLAKIKNDIDSKDKFNAQERLKLIDDENKLLDEILNRNLKIAKKKHELKVLENSIHTSKKEDLEEEKQLKAELENLEAQAEAQKKEAIAKRIEAQREAAQEAVALLEYELQIYLQNNKYKQDDFEKIFELQKAALDEQLNTNLIKQYEYNLKLLELENQKNESILAQTAEREQINYENSLAIVQDSIYATLELEKQGLEMKKSQELEYAEKIGADVEKINQKYARADRAIEHARLNAKLELGQIFASNLQSLFTENTKIAKSAAVAETTISTFKGAQQAFAAASVIPPPAGQIVGAAAAALVISNGLKAVNDILAVKTDSKTPGSAPSASVNTGNIGANITGIRPNVNPEIGAGIVSRQTNENNNQNISLQPVLPIDDVTKKQLQNSEIVNTSSI